MNATQQTSEQVYILTVDYNRHVADSAKAGNYDDTNTEITDGNFPSTETGKREVCIKMFCFGNDMFTDAVEAEMDKAGYRPATMKELLAYGEKNPDEQRRYPIIGLASVAKLSRRRYVGCLCGSSAGRRAYLHHCDREWSGDCHFLGVRKSA